MPWHKENGHADCPSDRPWAVVKDDDGEVEGCHATEAEADDQLAALNASENASLTGEVFGANDPVIAQTYTTAQFGEHPLPIEAYSLGRWSGILAIEGNVPSGDRREFDTGALEWRDMPLTMYWQVQTMPEHMQSVAVARIDEIWREGIEVHGRGVFDMNGENGREAHRLVHGGFIRGQSVSLDDIADNDVELIWPEPEEGEDEDELGIEMLFMEPERIVFHHGRVMDSLLTGQPAFQEAFITLEPDEQLASTEPSSEPPQQDREPALVAAASSAPPAAWFRHRAVGPTAWTVTDDLQCFGHLALDGTCHVGFANACITPPHEESFDYFNTGELITREGERVAIGRLTLGTNHAPANLQFRPALEHYENTGYVGADVTAWRDKWGIWVAGAVRPTLTEDQLRALRAAAISGDWRRIGSRLRLIGGLMVNIAGYPVPRPRAALHNGVQSSLVASGIITMTPQRKLSTDVAQRIAASIGRDFKSRREELRLKVHGR